MIPSSPKASSPPRARWTVLCAFVLLSGVAGECRWRFSSNTSGRNNGSQNSDVPVPLTLGGPSESVHPVPGGRALLYTRGTLSGEIRRLDLGTGLSWKVLGGLHAPWLVRVLEDRFEFGEGTCDFIVLTCRFGEEAPDPIGWCYFLAPKPPAERTLRVEDSRTLIWTEGDRTVEIPLAFPARGATYEPGWPAPLAWDHRGDLRWVDLASGAGVPAFPFGTGRR